MIEDLIEVSRSFLKGSYKIDDSVAYIGLDLAYRSTGVSVFLPTGRVYATLINTSGVVDRIDKLRFMQGALEAIIQDVVPFTKTILVGVEDLAQRQSWEMAQLAEAAGWIKRCFDDWPADYILIHPSRLRSFCKKILPNVGEMDKKEKPAWHIISKVFEMSLADFGWSGSKARRERGDISDAVVLALMTYLTYIYIRGCKIDIPSWMKIEGSIPLGSQVKGVIDLWEIGDR